MVVIAKWSLSICGQIARPENVCEAFDVATDVWNAFVYVSFGSMAPSSGQPEPVSTGAEPGARQVSPWQV